MSTHWCHTRAESPGALSTRDPAALTIGRSISTRVFSIALARIGLSVPLPACLQSPHARAPLRPSHLDHNAAPALDPPRRSGLSQARIASDCRSPWREGDRSRHRAESRARRHRAPTLFRRAPAGPGAQGSECTSSEPGWCHAPRETAVGHWVRPAFLRGARTPGRDSLRARAIAAAPRPCSAGCPRKSPGLRARARRMVRPVRAHIPAERALLARVLRRSPGLRARALSARVFLTLSEPRPHAQRCQRAYT